MARITPKERGNVINYYADNHNNIYTKQSGNWTSVMITNDGSADVTILINNMSMIVKANEVLDEDFEDFNSVVITASDSYRLWLRE